MPEAATITVHTARIVFGEEERPLNRALAKQIPIDPDPYGRSQLILNDCAPTPLCKVAGTAIGRLDSDWYLLVYDAETDWYSWVQPARFRGDFAGKHGIKPDDLAAIPTVVL